ncbi:MAG: hypothetical protein KJ041_08465, partial [Gammaproteobacteria bacterium]|nr:hypothetical protein [Gammaproteobacteria bacterium]
EVAGYLRHCLSAGGRDAETVLAVNAPASAYLYTGGVPRLLNTLVDAALGELQARQQKRIDADTIRTVADQLGWKPLAGRTAASPPASAAVAIPSMAARVAVAAPAAAARVEPPSLPATDITGRLLAADASSVVPTGTNEPATAPEAARIPAPVPASGSASAPSTPSAIPAMNPDDPGATGMLRLEDLDERFAETLFSEDSGHFKVLIAGGRPD